MPVNQPPVQSSPKNEIGKCSSIRIMFSTEVFLMVAAYVARPIWAVASPLQPREVTQNRECAIRKEY